jgi:t-SNARE complex subunit (syntaxin)
MLIEVRSYFVFSTQAVMSRDMVADLVCTVSQTEVQERHEDIKRIAQTMTELQELFNDMAMLVERQDESIVAIEASAQDVENNMEAGKTSSCIGHIQSC